MRMRPTCSEASAEHRHAHPMRVAQSPGRYVTRPPKKHAPASKTQPWKPRFLPRRGGQIGGHDGGHDRGTTFEDSHAAHVLRGTTSGTTFCLKLKLLTPPTFHGARHPTEWIIYNTTGVQGCDTMTHTHTQTVCHKCLSRFLPSQKRNAQVHVCELETELLAK